jgi:LPXTG-motif cell wall-anchored protein
MSPLGKAAWTALGVLAGAAVLAAAVLVFRRRREQA